MDRKPHKALALAIALFGLAGPAHAATITVNTGADTTASGTECLGVAGDCSLRRAIDKAVSGVDDIVIPTSVPTITLVMGNGPLTVDKNLTISGTGPGSNAIDGGNNIGLFSITNQRDVTISGVTLTHGKAQFGAAIDAEGGHLTLTNVDVSNNTAGGSNTTGFGVVSMTSPDPSTLTISGSSFLSNNVGGGGSSGTGFGVVDVSPTTQTADVTITDTDFTNNTVGAGGAAGFGVINTTPTGAVPTLELDSVVFRDNAVGNGGVGFGLVDFGGTGDGQTLTVRDSLFDSNNVGGGATGSDSNSGNGSGGGLYISPNGTSTTTVDDTTFTANSAGGPGAGGTSSGAGFGGAIYLTSSAVATLLVADSTFNGNSAGGSGSTGPGSGSGFGGAIFASFAGTDGTLSVTDSQFSANVAGGTGGVGNSSGDAFGGAVNASYGSTATVTVARNSFRGSGAGSTGGVGNDSGSGTGGALYLFGSGAGPNVNVQNNTITGSFAGGPPGSGVGSGAGVGGGLFLSGGTIELLNDTIEGNDASSGGGINAVNGGGTAVTLKNTIISGNTAGASDSNCSHPLTSLGHNLEGIGPSQCGFGAGDLVGVNPLLGPIADNGGPTLTQRLLPGSPAAGAGDNAGCPATDQRGVARPQGTCDIGAFELAPPVVSGENASALTTTGTTLAATVADPDLFGGTAHFEYGETPSYGAKTSDLTFGAQSTSPLSAPINGLRPGTLYHFRAVASNPDGTTVGSDHTFTTVFPVPKLGKIGVKPRNILPFTGRGASISKRKRGATISYTDSLAATTTLTVQKRRKGYRSGKRCVSKRPKRGKPKRCTFYKKVGSFKHKDKAGRNSFRFTGRVKRRPLKPGSYRFETIARSNGQKSKALHAKFRIVR